jgi:4-hydroxy-2-oxoglutarate aldolase
VQRATEILGSARSSFQLLVGSASMLFPSLAIGARGAILALGSAMPELCLAVFQAVQKGDLQRARELQKSIVPASRLIVSQCGIAGVKYSMDLGGYRGGLPRLPLLPLQEEQKNAIRDLMARVEASEPARLSGAVSV